ncbi:MAG: response regulator [Pseudomonadota bacterium]
MPDFISSTHVPQNAAAPAANDGRADGRGGIPPQLSPEDDRIPADKARQVLLLEDNTNNAMLVEAFFGEIGIDDVTWVKSIAEAEGYVSEIEADTYAMLVIDYMLPDGRSDGFVSQIRSKTNAPILAYTALMGASVDAALRNAGFDHVLYKPLSLSVFEIEVTKLLTTDRPH